MIRVCKTCKKEYKTFPSQNKVYCSSTCYKKTGANNPKWNGGKLISEGYIYTYKPDHPDAIKLGYVLEHRLIMEQHLGRRLEPSEAVHHLNHNRGDNRIENLHLCPSNGRHFIENHLLERDIAGRFYKAQRSVTYATST